MRNLIQGRASSEPRGSMCRQWTTAVQMAWVSEGVEGSAFDTVGVAARDLCAGGLSIRFDRHVESGTLGVALLKRGRDDVLIRGIEVRHCRYDEVNREFVLGCCWALIPAHISPSLKETNDGLSLQVSSWNDVPVERIR